MGRRFDIFFKHFAVNVLSAIAKVGFGASREVIDCPEPGSLLLCNHSSIWDFAYLLYALYPRTDIRFVATGVQFDSSRLKRWAFGHLEVIRKNQGASDPRCVREIIRTVREGRIAAVYAAGMTSFDGREAWNAMPGTGSLAHVLKCPIYTAVVNGGFISYPRFAAKRYRGKVEITVRRLLTAEECAALPAEEIQSRINEALRFNDWDWQARKRVPFRAMKNMRGITNTLYLCPSCGNEGCLTAKRGRVNCSSCSMTAKRDRFGFFKELRGHCPPRMDEWTDLELEKLRGELIDENFRMEDEVALLSGDNGVYTPSDRGTLSLTRENLTFAGEKGTRVLEFNEFQFLLVNDKDYLQANTATESLRFVFERTRLLTKWFFAHRMLMQEKGRL